MQDCTLVLGISWNFMFPPRGIVALKSAGVASEKREHRTGMPMSDTRYDNVYLVHTCARTLKKTLAAAAAHVTGGQVTPHQPAQPSL